MNTRLFAKGFVVAGALTGAVVLAGCNREVPAPPPPPAPAVVAQPEAPQAHPIVSRAVLMTSASPTLAEKARPILAPGTDVNLAIRGFQTPQQFMAVAYASKNLSIPFALLKHIVVTRRMTLARAISMSSKYSVNATLEAARAESEARADLARKSGPQ